MLLGYTWSVILIQFLICYIALKALGWAHIKVGGELRSSPPIIDLLGNPVKTFENHSFCGEFSELLNENIFEGLTLLLDDENPL